MSRKFVNEGMTRAERVEFIRSHRDLFRRCREHNLKVCISRSKLQATGTYISGFDVDAERLLAEQEKLT